MFNAQKKQEYRKHGSKWNEWGNWTFPCTTIKSIKSKKIITYQKNNDDKCFQYVKMAALTHEELNINKSIWVERNHLAIRSPGLENVWKQ